RSLQWYVQKRKLEEEQRRADMRIREQAALLDKAQDAIIVHDLNWQTQYWNKSAERLYGWTSAEVQQRNLRLDVFKTDELLVLEALQKALAEGEWSGELKQMTKDGKKLTVQSRWTLVRDDEGKPKSILVINTDITEKKQLEAQFLRTQRMESIGTLAGGIAHDLNNVLSPILMGVELLKMKMPDEGSLRTLNTMAGSAKRGSDMVKQVLSFARGHEGERTVVQVSHLIREMQKIIKETFPKSITYRASVDERPWTVMGDATQIHQILLNLCVNARDAMPEGGQLLIEAKNTTLNDLDAKKFVSAKPGNYLLLAVSDTGTGIPPEVIDKIFEPFFTTKEIGKGTGLGLSTVMSIIKGHGGFLDLKTELGKGTTFNVYLPAAEAAVAPTAVPIPANLLRGNGETIMVVDDEPAVLELTRAILIHHGYAVVTAIHGADALALFPQYEEKIKVVIIDMMMPVMDGTTAIRTLKSQHPHLKFIAISGLMQGDKIKQQLGNDVTFVPKPFTAEKLLETLREFLNADKSPAQDAEIALGR
ncbi:MAG: sensor hybrid histidine kinase, partial [Pedosphaera sp.]|nr:sensor hybrid histidine kinase [Pedosphaera sp.]